MLQNEPETIQIEQNSTLKLSQQKDIAKFILRGKYFDQDRFRSKIELKYWDLRWKRTPILQNEPEIIQIEQDSTLKLSQQNDRAKFILRDKYFYQDRFQP